MKTVKDKMATAVNDVYYAKLVILGVLFLTSLILALKIELVVKLVISGILSSIFLVIALSASFLTTSHFPASFKLLKSTRKGTNLSKSNLSTFFFKLLKLVGAFFNLSISNLSNLSDFKLAKSAFLAISDVLTPAVFF